MKRGGFHWRAFALAVAISLGWHLFYVIPRVIAPFLETPPEPLEVAYVPDEPKPTEPADPESARAQDKVARERDRSPAPHIEPPKKPAETPAPEVAKVEPAKPPLPPPPPRAPPPPPPKMDHRLQMVDQQRAEEEPDNAEARYLAQTNHKAAVETRARNTNLVREVRSEHDQSSEPNSNLASEVGAKDRKIAELENHAGVDKSMPRSSPMRGDEGTRPDEKPEKPGPLAMRDLTPRAAIDPVEAERAREGLDKQEDGAGDLPMARVGHDAERGRAQRKGGQVNLRLDHHNYDNIEGFDTAEKERHQAAKAESSHAPGRFDRYLAKAAAMRSALENFTFDVKPGNQSELGTRASPFAGYITAMHRQIHKLWTFGFLSDLDGKSSSKNPYTDETLWTQLEIVVKGDGSVDKVSIVRTSGVLPFDVAAIDSVMSAAPFPPPPKVIKSANGKVYLDWQFHRDERACGTFGVDPHILTTPGDPTEHDTSETGAVAHEAMKAARALGGSGGPRTLSRGEEELPSVRPHVAQTVIVPEVTGEVRAAAEGWFAAYARGDAAWLAGWSATPFTAAGETIAKDADKLKTIYKQLLAEAHAGARPVQGLEVLTPAGIRGRLGGLPPGGEESDMLYAVGRASGEEFILLMKKASVGWRVCGVDR